MLIVKWTGHKVEDVYRVLDSYLPRAPHKDELNGVPVSALNKVKGFLNLERYRSGIRVEDLMELQV